MLLSLSWRPLLSQALQRIIIFSQACEYGIQVASAVCDTPHMTGSIAEHCPQHGLLGLFCLHAVRS